MRQSSNKGSTVICSAASARSRWVQAEITAFKRLHGEHAVLAFIVSGEPKFAGAPTIAFPRRYA